jgi:hypothetical protein
MVTNIHLQYVMRPGGVGGSWGSVPFTDKKENKIFLRYREIQMGSGAKSYMYEEGLPYI